VIRQLARFGVVGIFALLMHWLTVVTLVPLGIAPLIANVIAFVVSFQVSYWGHRRWTFDAAHVPHRTALPRFLLIASLGFALNELLYFVFLRYTSLGYRVSLLIVLTIVPATTYTLSRRWGFR
jgi:putative flippase GtrA